MASLLDFLMQSQTPPDTAREYQNPYMPMVQGFAQMRPVQSSSDPWGAVGANFVQGFTSGLFGQLAQDRQAKIDATKQERSYTALMSAIQKQQEMEQEAAQKKALMEAQYTPKLIGKDTYGVYDEKLGGFKPLSGVSTIDPYTGLPTTTPAVPQAPPGALPNQQQAPTFQQTDVGSSGSPILDDDAALADHITRRMMGGAMPGSPKAQMAMTQAKDAIDKVKSQRTVIDQIDNLLEYAPQTILNAPNLGVTGADTWAGIGRSSGLEDTTLGQVLGMDNSSEALTARQQVQGLQSEMMGILKNARGITGGSMNSLAEMEKVLGDVVSKNNTPEANLAFLDNLKGRVDQAKKEIERATGLPYDAISTRKAALQAGGTAPPDAGGAPIPTPEPSPTPVSTTVQQIAPFVERQESGGNQNAVSPKGAMGVMQLKPETFDEVARKYGDQFDFSKGIKDEETNRLAGQLYLNEQLENFDGNLPIALAAYNAGPGRVSRDLKRAGVKPEEVASTPFERIRALVPAETRNYVKNILAMATPSEAQAETKPAPKGQPKETPKKGEALQRTFGQKLYDQSLLTADGMVIPLKNIASAIGAGVQSFNDPNNSFRDYYNLNMGQLDQDTAAARERQGLANTVGSGLAGAGMEAILSGGTSIAGKSLLSLAKLGAIEAAKYQGGRSLMDVLFGGKKLGEAGNETLKATGMGAVAGPVVGGVVKGGGKVLSTTPIVRDVVGAAAEAAPKIAEDLANLPKNTMNALRGKGSLASQRGAVDVGAEVASQFSKQDRKVAKAISDRVLENVDTADLEAAKPLLDQAQKQGSPLSLMDVLSAKGNRETRQMGRVLSNFSEGANAAGKALETRQREGVNRVASILDEAIDGPNESFAAASGLTDAIQKRLDDDVTRRVQAASPVYDKIKKFKRIGSEELTELQKSPLVQSAIQDARRIRDKAPRAFESNGKFSPETDPEILHTAKSLLNEKADDLAKEGVRSTERRVLTQKAVALKEALYNVKSPVGKSTVGALFKEADTLYAKSGLIDQDTAKLLRAFKKGEPDTIVSRLIGKDVGTIRKVVDNIGDDGKEALVGAVKAALVGKAESRKAGSDAAQQFTRFKDLEKNLRTILGDDVYEKIRAPLDIEDMISQGNRALHEGSSTVGNAKGLLSLLSAGVNTAKDAATGNVVGAINNASPLLELLIKRPSGALEKGMTSALLDTQESSRLLPLLIEESKRRALTKGAVNATARGVARGAARMSNQRAK